MKQEKGRKGKDDLNTSGFAHPDLVATMRRRRDAEAKLRQRLEETDEISVQHDEEENP